MFSKEQQEYLCDGYIRNSCIHTTPISINRIIQTFWNEYFWWTFKGDKLKQFLNAEVGDKFQGKQFKIDDIFCMPVLYPNGDTKKYQVGFAGDVVYAIHFVLPSHVKSAVVYYELYSAQTKAYYKSYACLSNCIGGHLDYAWTESMKLSEYKNENQFDFMYFVEILRIEYSTNCGKDNYYKNIQLKSISNCQWNLGSKMMQAWEKSRHSQCICGPSFDNKNWMLWCTPKGYANVENFCIGAKLLRMPYQIKKMNVKMILDIEPNIYHCELRKSIEIGASHLTTDTKMKLNDIIAKANNSLISIHCQIEISDVDFIVESNADYVLSSIPVLYL